MTIQSELEALRYYSKPEAWPTPDGSHWSADWGGSEGCWYYSIAPRLPRYRNRVIEIGCGHGQWVDYFRHSEYWGYDRNQECIDACKQREGAAEYSHFAVTEYDDWLMSHARDNCKVDCVFSWNSLVYSPDLTLDLIRQCGEVLTAEGTAFLHVGDVFPDVLRVIPDGLYVDIAERIDWPTGAANCWLLTLTRQPCETQTILHSTLRDEMRVAKSMSTTYGRARE